MIATRSAWLALIFALPLSLAACGKQGAPRLSPEDAPLSTKGRIYPAPQTVVPEATTAGQVRKERERDFTKRDSSILIFPEEDERTTSTRVETIE